MNTIFVSSTFVDMQYERDAIQHSVAPKVNEVARKYNQFVSFCDLRWGIDTQGADYETASRKVLDVCLDEIDRSDPPMVVLLGYRYGWSPMLDGSDLPGEDIEQSRKRKSRPLVQASLRKGLALDDLEVSVTELEIRFGSLSSSGRKMPLLCYFRELEYDEDIPNVYLPEDEEHATRLKDLKRRIERVAGGRIRTYRVALGENTDDYIKEFAQMLASDIVDFLLPDWKRIESLTPFQRTLEMHRQFMYRNADLLTINEDIAHDCVSLLKQNQGSTIMIYGKGGMGKSTVASFVARELIGGGTIPVLFLTCGLTSDTTTVNGVLKLEAQFLREVLGNNSVSERPLIAEDVQTSEDYRKEIEDLCKELSHQGKRAVMVIDALDQLVRSSFIDPQGVVSCGGNESVSILATCLRNISIGATHTLELTEIKNANEVYRVLDALESRHSHSLSSQARKAVLRKTQCRNPIYVSFLYQRLLMMHRPDFTRINELGGTMEVIARYEEQIVESCPDDLGDMVRELFDVAGKRINGDLCEYVVDTIASTRFGIRASDLARIDPEVWSAIDFSHFVNYLSDSFILRSDGRYDFAHRIIREELQPESGTLYLAQSRILDYLSQLPENDDTRASEYAYHCMKADARKDFTAYIKRWEPDEDRSPINAAAQCAYQQIMEDGGKWIGSYLRREESLSEKLVRLFAKIDKSGRTIPDVPDMIEADDWYVSHFVCFDLAGQFGAAPHEQEVLLDVLSECKVYTMKTVKKFLEPDPAFMAAVVDYKIAQTIINKFGAQYTTALAAKYLNDEDEKERIEECERAIRMLKWSTNLMKQLAKDIDTINCWSMLARMKLWLSRAFLTVGRDEEAIQESEECIDTWKTVINADGGSLYKAEYAAALSDSGRILLMTGEKENCRHAAELYLAALSQMGSPAHLEGMSFYDYIAMCTGAVESLSDTQEQNNASRAIALSRITVQRAMKYHRKSSSMISLRSLRDALHAHAYALQATGEQDNIRASVDVFLRACDCAFEVWDVERSEDARFKYLVVSEHLITVLHFLGGAHDYGLAAEILRIRRVVAGER